MYSQMIIVKPCSFISYNNIISEDIFPSLHMLFVNNANRFAVTFPAYSNDSKRGSLGNIIEVLCEDRELLAGLKLKEVFGDKEDYIKVKDAINETEDYVLFKRVHAENSYETQARRMEKRGNEVQKNLKMHIKKRNQNTFTNPFIMIRSMSTGKRFNLFVGPSELKHGEFSAYGLVKGQGD